MTIYRINVTREEAVNVLVEADSVAEAEEAALELANSSHDWEEVWDPTADAVALTEEQYPVGEDIWTGGPQGHDFQFAIGPDGVLKRVNS